MAYVGMIGDAAEQGVGIGVSTAGGAYTAGAAAATAGTSVAAAVAVPIIGGIAAAGLLIWAWIKKRNAQKVAATNVVNEAEPLLAQNRDAFLKAVQAGVATTIEQEQAVSYFDAVWAQVVHECSNPALGSAGERCISERQSGARPQWDVCAPNCPNWFELYRDPIVNADVPSPSLTETLGLPRVDVSSLVASATGGGGLLWLAGGAIALGLAFEGGK